MIVIVTLIIFIIIIFILMKKYKDNNNGEIVNKNLSGQINSSEIYISKAIQRNFYNFGVERLSKEQFKQILDNERDGQKEMFLQYLYDHYYGCDTHDMEYVPFSTLITEASKKSGLRIDN